MFIARVSLAALTVLLLARQAIASQHIVDVVWNKSGAFVHSALVPAGKFVEVCASLKVGEMVRWRFRAAAPLDFNVHYHVGESAESPARLTQSAAGDGVLQVGVKETYCWTWANKSADEVRVDLRLQR